MLLYRVSWTKWHNGHGCFDIVLHDIVLKSIFPATAGQGDEGSKLRSLNIGDVSWIGFVTHEKKGRLNRLLPMFLGPSLVGALLGLAILSLTVVFLNIATMPALQDLRIDGALLYPAFKSKAKEYLVYSDVSRLAFGFRAEADRDKTTKVRVQSVGKETVNTSSVIVGSLNLDETPYPQKVQIAVDDAATSTDYSVQVAKFGILPESLTVSGQTDSGKHFSLCIPWGYIVFNSTIHLPKGLKELKLSLAYQLYVMGLPWTRRSNDSFSTYFDRQIPREKCRYGRHPLSEQAAFIAHSGSGCFAGMQRSWMSCGKAHTSQTKRGLQLLNGNISGSFCPSIMSGECYPLKVSDGALEWTSWSLTNDYFEQGLPAKFNMLLHLPSDRVVILGGLPNTLEPKSDLLFTSQKRDMTHTFQEAMVLAPGVEVHKRYYDLTFEVVDGSSLVNTSVLQIIVFSEDMDCHLTHLLYKDSKLESISTPQRSCEGNPMGEVCKDGWKPTSSFVLPMSIFRQVLVQDDREPWNTPPLDLHARGTCRSLEDFMNDSFQDPNGLKVSLSLKQPREVLWVPMIAGRELPATKVESDLELLQQSDVLNVSGSWHKVPSLNFAEHPLWMWPKHVVALCGPAVLKFLWNHWARPCAVLQHTWYTSPFMLFWAERTPQHLSFFFSVCVKTPNVSQSLLPQSLREHNLAELEFAATLSCSDRLKSQLVRLELVVNKSRHIIPLSDLSPFEDFKFEMHWVLHRIPSNGNAPVTGSLKKKGKRTNVQCQTSLCTLSAQFRGSAIFGVGLMAGLDYLAFFACLCQVNFAEDCEIVKPAGFGPLNHRFAFPMPM